MTLTETERKERLLDLVALKDRPHLERIEDYWLTHWERFHAFHIYSIHYGKNGSVRAVLICQVGECWDRVAVDHVIQPGDQHKRKYSLARCTTISDVARVALRAYLNGSWTTTPYFVSPKV